MRKTSNNFFQIDRIYSVAINPDNRWVVTGSGDKSLKVFDLLTEQQIDHFQSVREGLLENNFREYLNPLLGIITCVTVSPEGRYIVYGCEDKSVRVFDYKIKQQIHHFKDAHKGQN